MRNTFLEEIKEQTISLRSGEVGSISLGFDDDIGVLQYDDALLPHWTELANALQFYQGKETYYVSFNRMQLTPPIINILAPGLKENQLKSLWFNGIEFDNSDVIEFAVDIIKANQQLMEFTWQYSQIDSKEDAPALSLAVASHPSIDKVRLENCFGVEGNIGYDALCALFVSGNGIVDTIDLEGNNISTGDTAIPDYITRNTPLKHLYLARNNLNDKDAFLIAQALKQNDNLRVLRLQDNQLTKAGQDAIRKALYDTSSLNLLAACNHTCKVQLIESNEFNEEDDKSVNRRLKLYQLFLEE